MRTVITSLKRQVDAKVVHPMIFLSLGLAQFICASIALRDVIPSYVVFAIFICSSCFPILYSKFFKQNALKHLQLFYIIPLLISLSMTSYYGVGEYLLQIVVMVAVVLLCFSEVEKGLKEIVADKKNIYFLVLVVLGITLLSLFLLNMKSATKFVTLITAVTVYLVLDIPGEKLLAFRHVSAYQKEKNMLYIFVIISVYAAISFTGTVNFWFYLAYVVSAVNLGFSFRSDKPLFLIYFIGLLLASLIPFGPKEVYIDSIVVSFVIMLLYLKSPILYFRNTKYGEVRVDYGYHSNKIYLLIDGIIQGERFLNEKDATKNLRYFGNVSNDSVVSSIFNAIPSGEKSNVAVLGLGSGVIAMFGGEKQLINFYEINPEIVKIAYDRRFFNYLSTSKSRTSVILGDAREQLGFAENNFYTLLFVDIYLGGDIPTHFLTVEAVKLYMSKTKENGLIALNITSDSMENIESIVSDIAKEIKLSAAIAYERYRPSNYHEEVGGLVKIPKQNYLKNKLLSFVEYVTNVHWINNSEEEVCTWVVLAKNKSALKGLLIHSRWQMLDRTLGKVLYTDEVIGYKSNKGEITKEVD